MVICDCNGHQGSGCSKCVLPADRIATKGGPVWGLVKDCSVPSFVCTEIKRFGFESRPTRSPSPGRYSAAHSACFGLYSASDPLSSTSAVADESSPTMPDCTSEHCPRLLLQINKYGDCSHVLCVSKHLEAASS